MASPYQFQTIGGSGSGSYFQNSITTNLQATSSADTWTNAESVVTTITLTAGTWQIGYQATGFIQCSSGTNAIYGNCAVATSGGTILSETISLASGQIASASEALRSVTYCGSAFITVASTTSYKLMIRCNVASGTGNTQLTVSVTAGLTNPDGAITLWARSV